jgi:type III secretion system YscQ/HrcQ family protein
MKTFSTLRRVETTAPTLANICAQLEHQGYQPQLSRTLPGTRYLRFHAQFEDKSELNGLLDLASWSKTALPALDGIDWLSMENRILQPLISEHPLQLALSHQHAPIIHMRMVDLVTEEQHTHDLPSLDASPGAVLVEQYIPHTPTDASEITSLNDLQIPLTFSIGYSMLPLSALTTIEVGDVLLIEHAQGSVSSNGKTLFTSELAQETIMILNRTEDESEHEKVSSTAQPTDNTTGLNSLPIELSVVLMEKTIPLNQFKEITPGEIIELPPSAMMDVEIRANQRCFARGELVQLANGQLGVEIRTLWTKE